MKKILWLVMVLLPVAINAQDTKFTIQGKIGRLESPALIAVSYTSGKITVTDTCLFNNGFFTLSGSVTEPVQGFMVVYHLGKNARVINQDTRSIWLEPGKININSQDSLRKAVISGSKLNDDQQALNKALDPYANKMKSFYAKNGYLSADKHEAPELISAYNQQVDKLKEEKKAIELAFMRSHPNSLVSLTILSMGYGANQGKIPDLQIVEPIYNRFTEAVKNTSLGKIYADKIKTWKQVGVGSFAPEFLQFDPQNRTVKRSDFNGKYVLVDFWASWCHPCRDENPNLLKIYELYKDKNFTIVSISLDEDKDRWLKAVREDKLPWVQATDLKRNNDARKKYGVESIPDNFLVAPDGKIIAKSLRGDDLNKKMKEVLGNNL